MTSTHTRPALNGVDVPTLFATLDAVKAQPDIAQFQFRARNEWISGTHNRSTIQGFYGLLAGSGGFGRVPAWGSGVGQLGS